MPAATSQLSHSLDDGTGRLEQARLGRAARALRRPLPRRARRLDGRRRAAVDPQPTSHLSTSSLQWVVSAYVLGYGGFLLLGGRAADLLGRRRVFLISLGVFVVASLLGGLAHDGDPAHRHALRQGRERRVHGAGRALDHHDDLRRGPGAQQGALGLHGDRRDRLLARARDRRAADRGRLALGVLPAGARRADRAASPAIKLVPDGEPRRAHPARRSTSPARSRSRRPCCCSSTRSSRRRTSGWASARTLGSFAGAATFLAAFVVREQRTPTPLVRLGILRSGALVRANLGAMALFGGWVGFQFIATLYMQQLRGWSALETGPRDLPGRPARRALLAAHRAARRCASASRG